ncbi:MAG: thiamine-phosphate kinase [Dehalococcoidia bacterium]|nr:thiamine-phosphate kinase [Dehalococcoidia bacterium]
MIELIKDATRPNPKSISDACQRLVIGIGDDTAAWHGSPRVQLATTDSLVENVHFTFESSTWQDLGHKSLAVNLSDIAAMGGRALYALVSLTCPGSVDSVCITDFYRGMTQLAAKHGVVIVGGNMSASSEVTANVFVVGEAISNTLLRRSSAQASDLIAVTGSLGGAAAAVAALKSTATGDIAIPQALMQALLRPEPRLATAHVLVAEGVQCAIDISDGLVADLGHICECSNVNATIQASQIPVNPECHEVAPDPLGCALYGGEDYELLFTCNAATYERVAARLDVTPTIIGEIMDTRTSSRGVVVVDAEGRTLTPGSTGWKHFGI